MPSSIGLCNTCFNKSFERDHSDNTIPDGWLYIGGTLYCSKECLIEKIKKDPEATAEILIHLTN